jgi:hypothetical protein
MPTAEDFRRELFQIMANAQESGRESIEISARELHARVGPLGDEIIGCRIAAASRRPKPLTMET